MLYIQADSTVCNSELERCVLLYICICSSTHTEERYHQEQDCPRAEQDAETEGQMANTYRCIYTAVTSQFNFVILLFFGVYSCRVCVCMYKVYIHRLGQCNVYGLGVYAV